ncbi:MAG: hypothetical protein ACYSX0_15965 [Planctomycetota bacterium]|jgi:hypothetical protein
MRLNTNLVLVGLLAGVIGLLLGGGMPIAMGDETKSSAEPIVRPPYALDAGVIWNFHHNNKVKRGEIIELAKLDSKEADGRHLVITHLELRTRHHMQVQVVEHRKDKKRVQRNGKPHWNKKVRRGEGFSLGTLESTNRWIKSGYSTIIGMKFEPGTRPAIEVTQGAGEIWIYAEGYWARR